MGEPAVKERVAASGWVTQRQLGRGQYGTAYLVEWSRTTEDGSEEAGPQLGDQAVAKVVSLECLPEKEHRTAFQEVELMRSLRHPYIVSLTDHFLTEGSMELVLVMEFCDSGDLRKEVKRRSTAKPLDHIPEAQIMSWFVQLTHALNYIHERYILHRDLKSSNIFMISNAGTMGSLDVKIGDFGISRVLEGTVDVAATVVGTPYYMSPEVCRSEPYSYKSDIWALGCVLYEMCMLKHAFESQSLLGLVYKIVSETYDPIPAQYSKELRALMDRVLDKSENTRPSGKDLLSDPYVKKFASRTLLQSSNPKLAGSTEQTQAQSRQQQQSAGQPPPPRERTSLAGRVRGGAGGRADTEARSPEGEFSPPSQEGDTVRQAWVSSQGANAGSGKPLSDSEMRVAVYLRRIRRALGIRRQNWLQVFASFDHAGNGLLPEAEFDRAMTSMALGLCEAEIREVRVQLQGNAASVQVERFGEALHRAHPEVAQLEDWARRIFMELTKEAAVTSPGKPMDVAIGAAVKVSGLQSAAGAKLNGLEGTVERWDAATCRWVVRFSDSSLKSIRDENLQVLKPAPPKEPSSQRDGGSGDTIAVYRLLCLDGETSVTEEHFFSVLQRLLPKFGEADRRRLLPMLSKSPEGRIDVPEVLSSLAVGNIPNGRPPADQVWHASPGGFIPPGFRGQRPGAAGPPARAWEGGGGGSVAGQRPTPAGIDTASPTNQVPMPGQIPSPRAAGGAVSPSKAGGNNHMTEPGVDGSDQVKDTIVEVGSTPPKGGAPKSAYDTGQSWRKAAPPREFVAADKYGNQATQPLKTQQAQTPTSSRCGICRCIRRSRQ
mmetsp:Transcript_46256/g.107561  ORF Transcript_46256/g.107561 Transcript_46256/m.107561 type:complete len:828 (-) Transcript_46256:130-2613(-)